jgi:hypothetical protein
MSSSYIYLILNKSFLAHLSTQKASEIFTKGMLRSGDQATRFPSFGVLDCGPAGRPMKAETAL